MNCKHKKECDGFGTCNIIPCNAEKHGNKYINQIHHYFRRRSYRFNIGYHNFSKTIFELNSFDIMELNK